MRPRPPRVSRGQNLLVRLVLAALLTVNFAWATDVHGPVGAADHRAAAATEPGGTPGPAHPGLDHPDDGHPPGQDHCLHCFGSNSHQPSLAVRTGLLPAPAAGVLPPDLIPDRPASRTSLPPERPPRA